MSTQKLKKGFTLIELMVVIVIIGILAAIAIPKLFGMSAKAKASEIAPAAGTWIKLQQAYALEKGGNASDKYGDFVQIGYTAPASKTFNYDSKKATAGEWEATTSEKLNECEGGKWSAKISSNAANSNVDDIDLEITGTGTGADKDKVCEALTPSFYNLGKKKNAPSSSSGG